MRRILLVLAALVFAMAAPTTTAQAEPISHFHFADHDRYVIDDFCGDIAIRVEFSERGSGVGRFAGPGREPRYTVTHHGEATYTNLATGRKFSLAWNYIDQDKRVTDNRDGTLRIMGTSPGSEQVRGPGGELLDVKAGLFRWRLVVDDAGTPTDRSDDKFVSIAFLSGPNPYTSFCKDFRTLTD